MASDADPRPAQPKHDLQKPFVDAMSAGAAPKAEALGQRTLRIWRGNADGGNFQEYHAQISAGMVVLDAVHQVQATQASDLACRWNCKAGKCGSCAAEINGKPRLMCMTRIEALPEGTITVQPMKAFKPIKDLVTDVSWNYQVKKTIPPFQPKPKQPDGTWRMQQYEVERVQEYRKCIECFLCQDTCHVLRDHGKHEVFAGPRFFVHAAQLEMHPLDTVNREPWLKDHGGIGFCNITKCCTEVCPEHIHITDNAIIPLKERVADTYYDPVVRLWRWMFKKGQAPAEPKH